MAKYVDVIKEELGLNCIKPYRKIGGGCNGENWIFCTSTGKLFTKISDDDDANILLHGEFKSLQALQETPNAVRVPKPIKVISSDVSTFLVTEFVDFRSLDRFHGDLGRRLAKLHLYNINLLKEDSKDGIKQFGFSIDVCCGKIPINNSWNDNWVDFYINQRIAPQVLMISNKYKNREVLTLWESLEPKIPDLFEGITVLPSLLHGDLWAGNAGETTTEPIIFDPASFYGHHEFDLAITRMFGGFNADFYTEYHKLIPRENGFEERKYLYELFHYLNHWNHFGGGYEGQSLSLMRKLMKITK